MSGCVTDSADMSECVTVQGEEVQVPCVYPAQLPGSLPPWQPAPEPYDEDKYTAWGRTHFGEEWFRRRSAAIKNRNFYLHEPDRQYKEVQRWLRFLEETVEGRRFPGGLKGTAWAEYWAAIPNEKKAVLEQDYQMTDDGQEYESDDESDSDYEPDTPDPSGEMRRRQLQRDRVRNDWDLETFHYHVMRLENQLIAERRNKYEDAIGDEQLRKELDEINAMFTLINSPGFSELPDWIQIKNRYQRRLYFLEQLRHGADKDVVMTRWRLEEQQAEDDRLHAPKLLPAAEKVIDNARSQNSDNGMVPVQPPPGEQRNSQTEPDVHQKPNSHEVAIGDGKANNTLGFWNKVREFFFPKFRGPRMNRLA